MVEAQLTEKGHSDTSEDVRSFHHWEAFFIVAKLNWWKIGFFIMLVLFEIAREWAVVATAEGAQPAAMKQIYGDRDYATAKGQWIRSDGGSPIVPSLVSIECQSATQKCIESSFWINDQYVFSPDISTYDAVFTSSSVSYFNDVPDCARYSVTINFIDDRAFATRTRKANPENKDCKLLESKVEMELRDSSSGDRDPLDNHFVPIFSLISSLAEAA